MSNDDYDYSTDLGRVVDLGQPATAPGEGDNFIISPKFSGMLDHHLAETTYDYSDEQDPAADVGSSTADSLDPFAQAMAAYTFDEPVLWNARQTFLDFVAAKIYLIPIAVAAGVAAGFALWGAYVLFFYLLDCVRSYFGREPEGKLETSMEMKEVPQVKDVPQSPPPQSESRLT
jgi:hypothetical protein